jgi:nucleoside-diphosphate-sugar epimerase
MRTLVMGGTRFLGVHVVGELLRAGHEVTVFHRGSRTPTWERPVKHVVGDRNAPQDLTQLLGLQLDAVLDLSA